jgi:hypothetical protein
MEGKLLKWTNYLYGWQERFCVLKGAIFSYYIPNSESHMPKGRVHLAISTIKENLNNNENLSEEDKNSDLGFEINTGSTVYFFKANNIDDKNNWIKIIKRNKVEAEKNIKEYFDKKNNEDKYSQLKDYVSNLIAEQNFHSDLENKLKLAINDIDNNRIQQPQSMRLKSRNQLSLSQNNQFNVKTEELNFSNKAFNLSKKEYHHIRSNSKEKFYSLSDEEENDEEIIMNNNDNKFKLSNPINLKKILPSFKKSFYDPLYNYKKRKSLPVTCKKLNYNVWEILKGSIGKDINRFTVPIFLNEPISMLQKLCENFQYASLLNKAAYEDNPYKRLAYSTCFCIGGFSMNIYRAKKFFNPILYETFEYIDNDLNYRYFSEQVSHHPAISALYGEGDGWKIYTNNNAKVKFFLNGSMQVEAIGRSYINFERYNDNIVYTKPFINVQNLIFGTMYLQINGKFKVINDEGDICEVNILPSKGIESGKMRGSIKDINGNLKYNLEGDWLNKIKIINPETKNEEILWEIIPWENQENYYYQPITFDLNNLTDEMKIKLPHTDSRFRPDQRLMEFQKIDEAALEKERLENKQRKARKIDKRNGVINKPYFFDETYDDITGELIYIYKDNYFEKRKNMDFSDLPDLFGKD